MTSQRLVTKIALLLCVVVLLFTLLDFAALHDIKQDYVSKGILDYLNMTLLSDLPGWTATTGEWQVVTASFWLRLLFLILNTFVLGYHLSRRPSDRESV